MGIPASQLDRRFIRLCPAVAKEHLVGERVLHQHLRELHLRLGVIEIRGVDQLRRLALDGLNQIRVVMPETLTAIPPTKSRYSRPSRSYTFVPLPAQSKAVNAYRSASNIGQRLA